MYELDHNVIDQALGLLDEILVEQQFGRFSLVVCGGAALIATRMVPRNTTRDVDVLALLDSCSALANPDPLPVAIRNASAAVARLLVLEPNWLNNGPSRGDTGLFQCGLPHGIENRLIVKEYGTALTVCFVGRLDQIHFKVFAAADQGPGRHFTDLEALQPTIEELETAARWATQHDPSDGFRELLSGMFKAMGHNELSTEFH